MNAITLGVGTIVLACTRLPGSSLARAFRLGIQRVAGVGAAATLRALRELLALSGRRRAA